MIILSRVYLICTIVTIIVHNFLMVFVGNISGQHTCSCEAIEGVKVGALGFFE